MVISSPPRTAASVHIQQLPLALTEAWQPQLAATTLLPVGLCGSAQEPACALTGPSVRCTR